MQAIFIIEYFGFGALGLRDIYISEIYITLLTTRFLHKKYGQYKHENLNKFTSQYSFTNYYKYLSLKKKLYHFKSHFMSSFSIKGGQG